jgi:hypothetical protein
VPEFNANWVVLIFGFLAGLDQYGRSRRNGATPGAAVHRTIWITVYLVASGFVWLLILDALRLSWMSLTGFGIGIAVALVSTLALLAFQACRQRPRHWR